MNPICAEETSGIPQTKLRSLIRAIERSHNNAARQVHIRGNQPLFVAADAYVLFHRLFPHVRVFLCQHDYLQTVGVR